MKQKTYLDTSMENDNFKEKFLEENKKLEEEEKEVFINRIEKYRDELVERRERKNKYTFIEPSDKGYINAISEVVRDLFDIQEEWRMVDIPEENNNAIER